MSERKMIVLLVLGMVAFVFAMVAGPAWLAGRWCPLPGTAPHCVTEREQVPSYLATQAETDSRGVTTWTRPDTQCVCAEQAEKAERR